MSFEEWGPLADLVGAWEGDAGVDVSFHNVDGKMVETPFRERTSFIPYGPIVSGAQRLYAVDYRMAAWRGDEQNPFHTEVGIWAWDGERNVMFKSFSTSRGSTLVAGAVVDPEASTFELTATLGSNTFGILSTPYLDEVARPTRYDVTVTIGDGEFSYDETTVVEHQRSQGVVLHTDRNTLIRVMEV